MDGQARKQNSLFRVCQFLSIDDHVIGDLPEDDITVVLAVGAYLQTGSPASHTMIVPAGATICFPKKHKVLLCREMKLPPSSRIVWPCDSEQPDPEVMQVHTQTNDRSLLLWITEGDEVTLPRGGELLFRPELASQSSASGLVVR
jgi:hypothetical protein